MANQKQLATLKKGAKVWNEWRLANINKVINLRGANLSGMDLCGANLNKVDLAMPISATPISAGLI